MRVGQLRHRASGNAARDALQQLLAGHILAKKHSVAVVGYSDALIKSAQHKVVDEELLGRLRPFFVFRNILVHQYWKVQDETFLRNLRAGFNDFREFARQIRRDLNKS